LLYVSAFAFEYAILFETSLSYSSFRFVKILWSFVVPAYTLCTGLGALVDMDRLHETKALHHLKALRKERLDMNAKAKEQRELDAQVELRKFRRGSKWKNKELATSFHLEKISELVKTTNDDLEIERQRIHHDSLSLRKTVSEGVAVMMMTDEAILSRSSLLASYSTSRTFDERSSYSTQYRTKYSGLEWPQSDHQNLPNEKTMIDQNGRHVVEKISIQSNHGKSCFEKMSNIINSSPYYILSGFLATSIAFFVVGMRIELFLINDNVLVDRNNSWKPKPESMFWTEISMLIFFMIEASICTVIYVNSSPYRNYITVSASEVALAGACLIILLVSESHRCEKCTTCPRFGQRICGGLGRLEPFTALIGLRGFTWLIVRPLLDGIRHNDNIDSCDSDAAAKKKSSNFCRKEGTMIDLWKKAVIAFPDIVEQHGLFSSELLEAMLDIPPRDELNLSIVAPLDSSFQGASQNFLYSQSHNGTEGPLEASNVDDFFEEHDCPISDLDSALIRVMRRCQQKLLPLLDEWVIVDMVITENEIIWFDTSSQQSFNRFNTHGGYGMRVSEVARGRTVIGRLSLKDIQSVSIEHRVAIRRDDDATSTNPVSIEEANINVSVAAFQKEFWEEAPHLKELSLFPTTKRWERVAYDALVVQSTEGTLVIRFLVDLVNSEQALSNFRNSQDDDVQNQLILNTHEASYWYDTISKKIGQTANQGAPRRAMMASLRKSFSMAASNRAFSI